MRFTDRGIVLNSIKTREKGLVLHFFSEEKGRISYFIGGIGDKKKGKHPSLIYPGALLEVSGLDRVKSSLGQVTQFEAIELLSELRFSFSKSALSIYATELLSLILPDGYTNPDLYHFIVYALRSLNAGKVGVFAVWFTANLSSFFGMAPVPSPGEYFDLREAHFCSKRPEHPDFMDGQSAEIFRNSLAFIGAKLEDCAFQLEGKSQCLEDWLRYLRIQNDSKLSLKSLSILQTLF
ncbi:MAG: hypothetical protein ACJAY8_000227 [Sphingobacteriales bacterium]|jgi:hypothetical protein